MKSSASGTSLTPLTLFSAASKPEYPAARCYQFILVPYRWTPVIPLLSSTEKHVSDRQSSLSRAAYLPLGVTPGGLEVRRTTQISGRTPFARLRRLSRACCPSEQACCTAQEAEGLAAGPEHPHAAQQPGHLRIQPGRPSNLAYENNRSRLRTSES